MDKEFQLPPLQKKPPTIPRMDGKAQAQADFQKMMETVNSKRP
jgi:hypothetical protein